jgi:hypothetical protein
MFGYVKVRGEPYWLLDSSSLAKFFSSSILFSAFFLISSLLLFPSLFFLLPFFLFGARSLLGMVVFALAVETLQLLLAKDTSTPLLEVLLLLSLLWLPFLTQLSANGED